LWVQTATSDTVGTTQRTTISTTAMRGRQRVRDRRCPASARSPAFFRRSSSRSGALVGRQIVEDVEGCVPAAVCLGHLGPPDRRRWKVRLPPAEGLRRHPYRMNIRVCASPPSPRPDEVSVVVSHRRMSVVEDDAHQLVAPGVADLWG
jgi:hypothetical protein